MGNKLVYIINFKYNDNVCKIKIKLFEYNFSKHCS